MTFRIMFQNMCLSYKFPSKVSIAIKLAKEVNYVV